MIELLVIILIITFIVNSKKSNNTRQNRKYYRKKYQKQNQQKDEWVPEWKLNPVTNMWEHVGPGKGEMPTFNSAPSNNDPTNEPFEPNETDIDFKTSYQRKYLFTKNELYNYKRLKNYADTKGYTICPKVRLLDIIEPIHGSKKYKTLFYKVQAKHVDFVVCDESMYIKTIIELDDSSHDREDRIERDKFVDEILRSVGYKVMHTRAITDEFLDQI